MESPGVLRLLRSGVFAAVCVATTALGHALMSGDVLPWWAVGSGLALTAAQGWWLTARERRAAVVVGVTVAAQALLHLVFDLAHALTRGPGGVGTAGHVPVMDARMFSRSGLVMDMGHSASGPVMHHPGTAGTSAGSMLHATVLGQGSIGMLLAHLLAALVCGLWLWRGEAAAHQVSRALAALLFTPLRRICGVLAHPALELRAPTPWACEDWAETSRSSPALLRHAVVRRGPPPGIGSVVLRLPLG
ncbi:hypothetical protein [Streptomyces sp. T028]|uniref:hypothetical protein n=1 Tax=Streptomyces sp. T028 TaxID=3394379 RepID=UPI003A88BE69